MRFYVLHVGSDQEKYDVNLVDKAWVFDDARQGVTSEIIERVDHDNTFIQVSVDDVNKQFVVANLVSGFESLNSDTLWDEVRSKPSRPPNDEAKHKCQTSYVVYRLSGNLKARFSCLNSFYGIVGG